MLIEISLPNQSCFSCRERRLKCQYSEAPSPTERTADGRSFKRQRPNVTESIPDHDRPQLDLVVSKSPPPATEQSSILIGPAVAEDVEILQRHISSHETSQSQRSDPYRLLFRDSSNPVIYLSVPRYRTGLETTVDAGKGHLEIVSQILGPFKNEVIELYLRHFHSNYPVIDDSTCDALRRGKLEKVSPSLLCTIYAAASPLWRKSDTLKLHPHPDYHYFWNKAISALYEDYISPSLATISSAIVEAIGRPSVSLVGNISNCGRTVALAQTFGLHRDPSKWNIPPDEKTTRIRLWWGVLSNDYWSSIAYGTPPHTAKGCYDVPLPLLESLLPAKATAAQRYSTICFLHLCSLTEILGDILPLVYKLNPDPGELAQSVDQLKCLLHVWESQLPEWLSCAKQPGSSNLWFCFLYIKLLVNRLSLRASILNGDTPGTQTNVERLDSLSTTSSAVLDFVNSLEEFHFQDFWLPYCGHLLVLATLVSLRCAVEARNSEIRSGHIDRLQQFVSHIQFARENYDWDIADYCLERCAGPITKIATLATADVPTQADTPSVHENGETHANFNYEDQPYFLSELLDSSTNLDFSWDALWDTPSVMSGFPL